MKNSLSKRNVDIKNGEYNALWSGYELEILSNEDVSDDILVIIPTINGVRGMNCKVRVEVIDGLVYEL